MSFCAGTKPCREHQHRAAIAFCTTAPLRTNFSRASAKVSEAGPLPGLGAGRPGGRDGIRNTTMSPGCSLDARKSRESRYGLFAGVGFSPIRKPRVKMFGIAGRCLRVRRKAVQAPKTAARGHRLDIAAGATPAAWPATPGFLGRATPGAA